jgi:Histidine kinase
MLLKTFVLLTAMKCFFIFCMCLSINCFGQSNTTIDFEHNFIGIKDGLGSGGINYMDLDSNHILWAITQNGLCRIDGYKIKKIQFNSANANSLLANNCTDFIIDSHYRIWISSEFGVTCYVVNENKFYQYTNSKLIHQNVKSYSLGQTVYEDAKGDIYIIFDIYRQLDKNNFVYFNNTEMFKIGKDMQMQKMTVTVPPFYVGDHLYNSYRNIVQYRNKEYASMGNRVFEIDVNTKQPIRTFDISKELPNGNIYMLEANIDDGNIELLTFGETPLMLNVETGKVIKKNTNKTKNKVQINASLDFNYLGKNYFLGASNLTAFYLYDSTRNWFTPYYPLNAEKTAQFVNSYILARPSKIYASYNSGIYEINIKKPLLQKNVIADTQFNHQLNSLVTNHFVYNHKHYCCIFNNGIKVLDSNFNTMQWQRSLQGKPNNQMNATSKVHQIKLIGNIAYLATDTGMVVWNLSSNKINYYSPATKDKRIYDFVKTTDSTFLCSGQYNSLFIFNCITNQFVKTQEVNSLFKNQEQNIRLYKLSTVFQNKVWITTASHGIIVYNIGTQTMEPVFINGLSNTQTSTNFLLQKKDHIFLLSTNKGIYTLDLLHNKVIRVENINGNLGSCSSIAFDADSNLWVMAANGIWCHHKKYNKWIFEGGDFELMFSANFNAFSKDNNNNLYVGIIGKIVKINYEVLKNKVEGNTFITEATTQKQNINFAMRNDVIKEIIVDAYDTKLEIDFSLYNKNYNTEATYWYQLEPLQDKKQLQNTGHITLTGLPHGKYKLTVGGTDKYGNPFPNTDTLYITIQPKWYQTLLFKLLAILLIGFLVYQFVASRIKLINDKSELKEKLTQMEMSALRAQMNPHFIFNTLNSINSYIIENKTADASNYITKFSRLIRNILENSKNEFITIEKELETIKLYLLMENIRFQNKFSYTINASEMLNDLLIPPMIIQPYVENAIWHGLLPKTTPGNLQIEILQVNNKIQITITDDGVGYNNTASQIKPQKFTQKSYGSQITKERILNSNPNNSVQITELLDEQKNVIGTKVLLQLVVSE